MPKTLKSFVEIVNNVYNIPRSQTPIPCVKVDKIETSISEEEYKLGLEVCKNNLRGRIIWKKGSSPLTMVGLRTKHDSLWKSIRNWGITSLEKSFFELPLSCLEDIPRVRSMTS